MNSNVSPEMKTRPKKRDEKEHNRALSPPIGRRIDGIWGKIGYLLYQPYKWLVYVPFLGLSTLLIGGPTVLTAIIASPKLSGKFWAVLWARLNAYVTPMRVTVTGRDHIDPDQSYVIVSNHQSQFDIFAVYGWLGIDFRWVIKQEFRKVPILGFCCEKLEHIYIDRSNRAAALASLNAAKEKIVGGTSILFFPEGTRSRTGKLLPFKKGAFRMALDLQLPILPITIIGTKDILPAKTVDLFPGRVKIIVHQAIPTQGLDETALEDLMKAARERMNAGFEEELAVS